MPNITNNYQQDDILYGRFDQTDRYWARVLEHCPAVLRRFLELETARQSCPKVLRQVDARTPFDDLDDPAKETARKAQTHAVISYFHKGFDPAEDDATNLAKIATPSDNFSSRFNSQREGYHKALYASRYSPFRCVQIDANTGAAAVKKVGNYDQYLRRACKFGVTESFRTTGARIHFVLDEINMADVLGKTEFPKRPGSPDMAVPITTSEIRATFRLWETARHHVTFYRNFDEVRPPWETDPADWLDYAKRRCKKYADLITKQGVPATIPTYDHVTDITQVNGIANALRQTVTQRSLALV